MQSRHIGSVNAMHSHIELAQAICTLCMNSQATAVQVRYVCSEGGQEAVLSIKVRRTLSVTPFAC